MSAMIASSRSPSAPICLFAPSRRDLLDFPYAKTATAEDESASQIWCRAHQRA